MNDAARVDIDPTKYYIRTCSHPAVWPYRTTEFADLDNHIDDSASSSAHNSSRRDVQACQHFISDSAPTIDRHVHNSRSADSHGCSSAHLEAWQFNGRGHVVKTPPMTTSTNLFQTKVSDLNLTNSMTSLIQSGSTTSNAWPQMSASSTSLVQPGSRKPPSGQRQGRPAKRTTRRLQSDYPESAPSPNNRSMSDEAVSRSSRSTTPLRCPKNSADSIRNRALSSVFSPQDGAEDQQFPVRPIANRRLRRPVSVDVLDSRPVKTVHNASSKSVHGDRNQILPAGFPGETEMTAKQKLSTRPPGITPVPPRHTPTAQRQRTSNSRLTTNRCPDMSLKPGPRPQPRPQIRLPSDKPYGIPSKKSVSLVEVTSGQRVSNSNTIKSRFPRVQYPDDVTNVAEAHTAVGVASSRDSLSDEGYQTKDSGSMCNFSLKRKQLGIPHGGPLLFGYL